MRDDRFNKHKHFNAFSVLVHVLLVHLLLVRILLVQSSPVQSSKYSIPLNNI